MDNLDAQFEILKVLSPSREIDETVVNGVLSKVEDEVIRQKVLDWIGESKILVRASREVTAFGISEEKVVALVRSRDNDRNLAVFGHDPASGRVVSKIAPGETVLQKLFDRYADKGVVVMVQCCVNGSTFLKRERVVPTDEEYLKHLLSRFIIVPYDVRWIKRLHSMDRLDMLLDNIFSEEVI